MSEVLTVIKGHFYSERHGFNENYSEKELKHFVGIPFSNQDEDIQEACEHNSSGIDRLIRQVRESINREKDSFTFFVFTKQDGKKWAIICEIGMEKHAERWAVKKILSESRDFFFDTTRRIIIFKTGEKEESIMRHVFLLEPLKV